jgi:hypothetical protein
VILARSGWVRNKERDGTSKGGFGFFVELYLLSTFLQWASASGHNQRSVSICSLFWGFLWLLSSSGLFSLFT